MFDVLLGRSAFYTKCKSLIKQTRKRIEVVRRKRSATQKFLRKDIADLLANNLDSTAFERADGLIVELILSSCYDFIDHVCEIVLKHLSVLQKLRDCPEDCREAVASLMFAAARFSDLPELRDLRNLLQERYGSSLELYVNQKLVENISAKPPSEENKLQLLRDIALEFSVSWDSRSFEERMSNSAMEKNLKPSLSSPIVAKNKIATPLAEVTIQKTVRDEPILRNVEGELNGTHQLQTQRDSVHGRKDDLKRNTSQPINRNMEGELNGTHQLQTQRASVHGRKDDLKRNTSQPIHRNMEGELNGTHQLQTQRDGVHGRKDDLKHNISQKSESESNKHKPPSYSDEPINKVEDHSISFQRITVLPGVRNSDKVTSIKDGIQINPSTMSQQKSESRPTSYGINSLSPLNKELSEKNHAKSMRKGQVDVTDGPKTNFRGGVPPPYMKPRNNKNKTDGHREDGETLTLNPGNGNRAEKLQTKADISDRLVGRSNLENEDGQTCVTEIYYKGETNADFTPRRRSHRRKHSKSSSTQDIEVNSDERVLRRVSTSRRRHESQMGLQSVVGNDDDPYQREEEEEKNLDKLLLRYSKKPSSGDPGKSRRKDNASKSQHHKAVDGAHLDEDSTPTTSRSVSLPSKQVTETKLEKEFTRAASFQPDTPAKHVHPKLPDYDDLAARFAALRAAKS
ncbi:uncharacterized protein LOC141597316 [Silene latifolia]|uniref:uncharacterized protein LOC141597316 n=1 Tax=Silene latifolia TaxID=37657 RepID=UPI003D77EB39